MTSAQPSKIAQKSAASSTGGEFRAFLTRLHFYIGLFVGPFILVAALSGTAYVLTPQLENYVYRSYLNGVASGQPQSLEAQVNAARAYYGADKSLFAVRPATAEGKTTRVMFADPKLGDSETRAVFVDPVTLDVKGDLVVYGTSGVLPIRWIIDVFHRNMLLGDFGRNYSELAASWLWIATIGGFLLWFWRRGTDSVQTSTRDGKTAGLRRVHTTIGLWIGIGLLFLSATGLTWSKYAGDNITALRKSLAWETPSVSLKLEAAAAPAAAGHAAHADHSAHADHGKASTAPVSAGVPDPATQIDQVLATAKSSGIIDSPLVEIRPSKSADKAWMVREYDRSTPTQVDTVAVDPRNMTVTSRADFATFTIVPKLIRWGIDLHMGIKFGVLNQIVIALIGSALSVSIVYGYAMWWKRRPPAGAPARTLAQSWLYLGFPAKLGVLVVGVALGFALPLMGLSLLAFVVVDLVRWRLDKSRRAGRRLQAAPAE
ncbi:PepSY-associated TM helix domain-containing protein [Rhizobium sp. FKY42]|uniref:PepSY-associated TM helix domain-containing protein n=1 Tax=Rhizobium sp. FKY42 TaxID=2562310 RepID=UPI0010BFDD69|nr:PepSY-associated TM helix domain-containing protein [Rhizobium sp. FKY42]